MIPDVLAMAARCEAVRIKIRRVLPPDVAKAVEIEAGRRSLYTTTSLADALDACYGEALRDEFQGVRTEPDSTLERRL